MLNLGLLVTYTMRSCCTCKHNGLILMLMGEMFCLMSLWCNPEKFYGFACILTLLATRWQLRNGMSTCE